MARVSTPRVKTGCITCRIRRVKCDEGKPFCRRCLATGRKCDGYTTPQHTSGRGGSSNIAAQTADERAGPVLLPVLMTAGNYSLPFRVPGSQRDRQLLHYFCVQGSGDIGGYLAPDFWSRTVLQASQDEPAVRHAVVALSSLHLQYIAADNTRFLLAGPGTPQQTETTAPAAGSHRSSSPSERYSASPPTDDGRTTASSSNEVACLGMPDLARSPTTPTSAQFSRPKGPTAMGQEALRNYGRALRALQKRIDRPSPETPRGVTLVCCALLSAFESALGNAEGALRHVENGLRILASPAGVIDTTGLEGIDDLVDVFIRLDIQAALFNDRRVPYLQMVTAEQRLGLGLPVLSDAFADICADGGANSTAAFQDLHEMHWAAARLQNWILRFLLSGRHMWEWPVEQLAPALLEEKELVSRQIVAWQIKSRNLIEKNQALAKARAQAKAEAEGQAQVKTEEEEQAVVGEGKSPADERSQKLKRKQSQRQKQKQGRQRQKHTPDGEDDGNTDTPPFNFSAAKVLQCQIQVMNVMVRSNFPEDFTHFRANPNYELRAVLQTFEEVLKNEERQHANASTNTSATPIPPRRSFSSELGIVAALFVLVVKSLDDVVCVRAAQLLSSLQRREGLHDSEVLSASVRGLDAMRSMTLPQEDLSPTSPRRLPLEDWADGMMDAVRVGEDILA